MYLIFEKNFKEIAYFKHFLARDSAEASVDLSEASVSAETNFSHFGRTLICG